MSLVGLQAFIFNRKLSGLALLLTVLTLLVILGRAEWDAEWLRRDYNLVMPRLLAIYGGVFVLLAAAFAYEPAIRAELTDGKATALIAVVMLAASFFVVWLIVPDQQERWFRFPLTLWFIIGHVIGLCAIVMRMALQHPDDAPTRRMTRYAMMTVFVLGALLVYAHVASVGSFMLFDFPDEPWSASAATNYAQTGEFSRSYNAGVYGDKDPSEARYYALMGLWLRAAGSSLTALRAFPLMVAGVIALVLAVGFWRTPWMSPMQSAVGVVTLLALSTFVRTSHSLIQDIGVGLYGALVLVFFLFYRRDNQRRWLFLMGLSLYVGLETIPIFVYPLGGIVGLAIVALSIRRPLRQSRWQDVVVYGAACCIAIAVFLADHFLPDPALKLEYLNRLISAWGQGNIVRSGEVTIPAKILHSMVTSPVEVIAIVSALVYTVRYGTNTDRWIAGILGITLLTTELLSRTAFSYYVMFAPFAAYLVARMCRQQWNTAVVIFVLLAAMVSAPFYDMLTEAAHQKNSREVAEADLLTWQIPQGSTVLGEDIFFFTLHQHHYFVGYRGLTRYMLGNNVSQSEAIDRIGVDVIICFDEIGRCPQVTPEGFAEPFEFVITRGRYLVYMRD